MNAHRFLVLGLRVLWAPTLVYVLQYLRQHFLPGHSEFDCIAHFFGGFVIAYSALIFYRFVYPNVRIPTSLWFLLLVFSAAFVGIAWEWYEWLRFHTWGIMSSWDWWTDTVYDLLMDTLGAMLYACIAVVRRKI